MTDEYLSHETGVFGLGAVSHSLADLDRADRVIHDKHRIPTPAQGVGWSLACLIALTRVFVLANRPPSMLTQHRTGTSLLGPFARGLGLNPELLRRRNAADAVSVVAPALKAQLVTAAVKLPHVSAGFLSRPPPTFSPISTSRPPPRRPAQEQLRSSCRKFALSPAASSLRTSSRLFSTSTTAMGAFKIDGTAIAKRIREGLASEILERQATNPRFKPSLKIIQGEHWLPRYTTEQRRTNHNGF